MKLVNSYENKTFQCRWSARGTRDVARKVRNGDARRREVQINRVKRSTGERGKEITRLRSASDAVYPE